MVSMRAFFVVVLLTWMQIASAIAMAMPLADFTIAPTASESSAKAPVRAHSPPCHEAQLASDSVDNEPSGHCALCHIVGAMMFPHSLPMATAAGFHNAASATPVLEGIVPPGLQRPPASLLV
jgi:hypothetical protein